MTDERPGRHGVVRLARNVVLCARCDQDDPSAGALITFFTVHGEVTLDTAPEFTALAGAWAASVRAPGIDPAALEADIEAWHRGELDADQPPPPGPYAPDDGRLEWQDEASDWP